jgi:hypothetical protein
MAMAWQWHRNDNGMPMPWLESISGSIIEKSTSISIEKQGK